MASLPIPTTSETPSRVAGAAEAESVAASTLRTTKRKLDDAFQSLDSAVSSPEIQRPLPKRTHTIRSLYSTLAKYGIKGKEQQQEPFQQAPEVALPTTTKSTPYLSAILARAAKRTRKALSSKFGSSAPPLPPTADYRPSSLPAFLARLSTFKLSTYANKPSAIDAVAASKCGWINDGKDRLVCGLCRASWVIAGRDGMSKDAANALLEKQRVSLVDAHKDGCPWKSRQCDPTIYCIPLQSPAIMVKDIKANAMILDPWLHDIEIKHPLTSTQITSLRSTLSTVTAPSNNYSPPSNLKTIPPDQDDDNVFSNFDDGTPGPSNAAILTSLFGWSLAPTTSPDSTRRLSLTRTNSLVPSTPRSSSLSRSSSVHPMSPLPSASPSVQQGTPTTPSRAPSTQFTFRMPSNVSVKRDTILYCTLCQRRIGLWAFVPEPYTKAIESRRNSTDTDAAMESASAAEPTPNRTSVPTISSKKLTQRPFDVLKEHRAYCPYVVRSTIVPTFPLPIISGAAASASASASSTSLQRSNSVSSVNSQSTTLEGWRAVLTVVLRYGVVQRQRLGLDFVDRLRGDTTTSDELMEVDGVKAMIAGVKKRGGKDLLQYVKGLLG